MSNKSDEVFLGFADSERELDYEVDFPIDVDGKIGGKPVWLDFEHPPEAESLHCTSCQKPMPLLLQIYAPIDSIASAFHRTLYVFCCKNGECHKSQGRFKVLRCQLPEHNTLYVPLPHEDDSEPRLAKSEKSNPATLCEICASLGNKACGNCKQVHYCSRQHQLDHWNVGHSQACKKLQNKEEVPKLKHHWSLFKEFELITEKEVLNDNNSNNNKQLMPYIKDLKLSDPSEDTDSDEEEVAPKHKKNEPRHSEHNDDEDNALVQDLENISKDKVFLKFQEAIRAFPDQVLRYYGLSGGAAPIWVNKDGQPTPADIPKCPHCHGPKVAEFQITPQLLYMLEVDKVDSKDTLDWGILTVYSCQHSCPAPDPKKPYLEEFLWRQHFAAHDTVAKKDANKK